MYSSTATPVTNLTNYGTSDVKKRPHFHWSVKVRQIGGSHLPGKNYYSYGPKIPLISHYKLVITCYNITTLLRGGRTQIARHNLDVFEGGGPVKCWQTFLFFKLRLICKISF